MYETTALTIQEIADECEATLTSTWKFLKLTYPDELRQNRKRKNYSKAKSGSLNPMFGKTGEKHHNFIGEVSDGKGYLLQLKPDWYTGRGGSKHVFVHHIVMCEHLGITEIPEGWCVHHIDEDKTNNVINNLEMMTKSDHMKLHASERKAALLSASKEGR